MVCESFKRIINRQMLPMRWYLFSKIWVTMWWSIEEIKWREKNNRFHGVKKNWHDYCSNNKNYKIQKKKIYVQNLWGCVVLIWHDYCSEFSIFETQDSTFDKFCTIRSDFIWKIAFLFQNLHTYFWNWFDRQDST